MDSRCNKSCTEDNATKVFELIITNPSSEPSKPVDISCVIQDLTGKMNALDNRVSQDGFTNSDPIVIDDLDDEEVKTTDENSSKDDAQKRIEASTETRNNVKESVVEITFDCNDNQKEYTENVIILDETNTKLTSGQITNKVVQNINLTTDSDLDLYETELQKSFDADKTNSRIKVKKISKLQSHKQNAVDIDTGKNKETKKAVCSNNIAKKGDPKSDSNIDVYATESQNVVTLNRNREDSDIILLDSKTSSENTVIPDYNEITIVSTECPSINLVDEEDNGSPYSQNLISEDYADELKNNSLLAELVQKCFNMESNGGMSRVINRTFLYIYKSVDEEYKKSEALRKVMTTTIMKLHMEPEFKFSHIKCLCDHLKAHMVKKRVPFVTLEKRSAGGISPSTIPIKKRRMETIDLDNYAVKNQTTTAPIQPKEYPPIEIDDSSSSIEEVYEVIEENSKNTKKKKIKRKKKKKPKRGQALASNLTLQKKKLKRGLASVFIPTLVLNPFSDPSLKEIPVSNGNEGVLVKPNHQMSTRKEPKQISKSQTKSYCATQIGLSREEPEIISPLLSPIVMDFDQLHKDLKRREIEEIEKQIGFLREQIVKLEEMEVQVDDDTSPYIVSEQYQSLLVQQYKRLCELTGTQVKKRHKVRLHVLPGHPEAPVRYLQEFLNDNIDDEGNPPFPDLYDVIECVSKANLERNMNWGQAQIMKEARSLFIHFGKTMQKRRQKREWKDLMSRVKEEVDDPAEQDEELMAKLKRNSWIAKHKENALLDRYASLEQTGLNTRIANELNATIENGDTEADIESSDDENANPQPYASINTFGMQNNVGTSRSVTNGSIGIPATYDKQNESLGIPATYEKQGESLGIPATYEKQGESLGIPATYEKQGESLGIPATCENREIVGSAITLSNGYIQIAPTFDAQKSSILIPNSIITTVPFQLNSNNVFGVTNNFIVNGLQNAANSSVVNGIQNVISPENRVTKSNDLSMYSLEFQKFTSQLASASNTGKCNLCADVISNVCFHNRKVSTVNYHNVGTIMSNSSNVINPNVNTVNSNAFAVNNHVYLVNNSNVSNVNNHNVGTIINNASNVINPYVNTVNSNAFAVNSDVYLVNDSNVTTVNNSNVSTVNNLNLRVVNSNACAVNNNLTPFNSNVTNDNSNEILSAVVLKNATSLAKTIMELVQKDVSLRTSYVNQNGKEIVNSHGSTLKITDAKIKEKTNEKMDKSVCDVFTHKTSSSPNSKPREHYFTFFNHYEMREIFY